MCKCSPYLILPLVPYFRHCPSNFLHLQFHQSNTCQDWSSNLCIRQLQIQHLLHSELAQRNQKLPEFTSRVYRLVGNLSGQTSTDGILDLCNCLDVCFSLGLYDERDSVASRADAQPMETRASIGSRRRVGWPAAAGSPAVDDELFSPEPERCHGVDI